jgi:hypothetical protein
MPHPGLDPLTPAPLPQKGARGQSIPLCRSSFEEKECKSDEPSPLAPLGEIGGEGQGEGV